MDNSINYDHRIAVGGLWEEIGILQFNFLVERGLKPEDFLLDIGCGSLRGGIHFIKYLIEGHYYGIDKNDKMLSAAQQIEIPKHQLQNKNPILRMMDNFNFKLFDQKFNYALAQSVFTHLNLNSIIRCILNVEEILVKNGKFYATFFENKTKNDLSPITHQCVDGIVTSHHDQDPYHYNYEIFEWICKDTLLKVDYIGNWNHPRDQKMLCFTKL